MLHIQIVANHTSTLSLGNCALILSVATSVPSMSSMSRVSRGLILGSGFVLVPSSFAVKEFGVGGSRTKNSEFGFQGTRTKKVVGMLNYTWH